MGLFNYNNPLIVFLVRTANMMIVSFYWLLCCLPVVTILPASAALYYSVTRVVLGNGNGVTRAFFTAFKSALKPGIVLSILVTVIGLLVANGIRTGTMIWNANIFGTVYMALGILIGFLMLTAVIFMPAVLSRFEGSMSVVIRLSMYFAGQKPLRSAIYCAMLFLFIWMVDFFPLALLILPAVYMDLVHYSMEKAMLGYIRDAGLEDAEETAREALPEDDAPTAKELDKLLSGEEDHE